MQGVQRSVRPHPTQPNAKKQRIGPGLFPTWLVQRSRTHAVDDVLEDGLLNLCEAAEAAPSSRGPPAFNGKAIMPLHPE